MSMGVTSAAASAASAASGLRQASKNIVELDALSVPLVRRVVELARLSVHLVRQLGELARLSVHLAPQLGKTSIELRRLLLQPSLELCQPAVLQQDKLAQSRELDVDARK